VAAAPSVTIRQWTIDRSLMLTSDCARPPERPATGPLERAWDDDGGDYLRVAAGAPPLAA
jgi:hypothetical protein